MDFRHISSPVDIVVKEAKGIRAAMNEVATGNRVNSIIEQLTDITVERVSPETRSWNASI